MKANLLSSSFLLVLGAGAINGPRELNTLESSSSASRVWRDVSRALLHNNWLLGRDSNPKNATNIEKSWTGATLLSFEAEADLDKNISLSASVEVTCTTCYVKGLVTAELKPDREFNVSQAIANFTEDIGEEIRNITGETITYLVDTIPELAKNLTDDFDFDDISLPALNSSFNLELPDIPECRLHFQLDDFELYLLVDTVLSAETMYTLNLYSSNTPLGLSIDSDTFLGVVVDIDLILSADANVDISTGLHVRIDDGMTLDLSLFSHNVSNLTINGGSFEFLPVTVQSANGVLKAVLRVGMHAGVSLSLDKLVGSIPVTTGAEVMVYADLAEFTTNITALSDGDDDDCQLRVQQVYQLALGAAAGATLAVGFETWGPDPSTKVPIFYTTLADACAKSVIKTNPTTNPTTAASMVSPRADEAMTITTLSEEITFTGTMCLSTGFVACPASLQSLTKVVSTKTSVVTVPSGSKATFPATTQTTISEIFPFAKNAKSIAAMTGSPVSYVPPITTTATSSASPGAGDSGRDGFNSDHGGKHSGTGVNKPLVIGLSVGLGVPFLAAVVAASYFLVKRHKYSAAFGADSSNAVSSQEYIDKVPQEQKTIINHADST
ncbi:hypothetical protein GGS21DRAFT_532733 [Xylaria nigripes]|nr:hypothetical protein GGS21DRAFT_532733 [Xylaria nigripes]